MSDWNAQVMAEFREKNGTVKQFGDVPLLILHTIGAKSGQVRETPLVTLIDETSSGEHSDLFVFASKGGATTHPDWYFNLLANPQIDVELGAKITGDGIERIRANIVQLPADIAAVKIIEMDAVMNVFANYVETAKPRVIPGFQIHRV